MGKGDEEEKGRGKGREGISGVPWVWCLGVRDLG